MASLTTSPAWQRSRAARLHAEFTALHEACLAGLAVTQGLTALSVQLDGLDLGGHPLRASYPTLRRAWDTWQKAGRKATALLPKYQGGSKKMPPALHREIQRIASAEVGGRDKHGRGWEAPRLRAHLQKLWHRGASLPGLGTWQEWWGEQYPHLALPPVPPEFPFCAETIRRKMGSKAALSLGNRGIAAAKKHLYSLTLDYSQLRKCELFTLDDVRLDLAAIDDLTGDVVNVTAYVFMEVASRSIVSFLVKPEKAIKAEDVDELVAAGLQADGYGIGVGYTTHIKFERGTVACSEAAQRLLESASDGGIKVHRTGMDGGIRWVGAAADRGSGHAAGKAVIESFNRNLHRRLLHLPGQRGNTMANQPANLGIERRGSDDASRRTSSDATAAAEKLGQFRAAALMAGERPALQLPLLLVSQVQQCVAQAMREHNTSDGHGMQDFRTVTQAETAPGVWQEVQS